MKKKTQKLVLHRETLKYLEASQLTRIEGGASNSCNDACPSRPLCEPTDQC